MRRWSDGGLSTPEELIVTDDPDNVIGVEIYVTACIRARVRAPNDGEALDIIYGERFVFERLTHPDGRVVVGELVFPAVVDEVEFLIGEED